MLNLPVQVTEDDLRDFGTLSGYLCSQVMQQSLAPTISTTATTMCYYTVLQQYC
jgi:hypothetical protein